MTSWLIPLVLLCLRGRAGPHRSLTVICSLSKIIEIKDFPLSQFCSTFLAVLADLYQPLGLSNSVIQSD